MSPHSHPTASLFQPHQAPQTQHLLNHLRGLVRWASPGPCTSERGNFPGGGGAGKVEGGGGRSLAQAWGGDFRSATWWGSFLRTIWREVVIIYYRFSWNDQVHIGKLLHCWETGLLCFLLGRWKTFISISDLSLPEVQSDEIRPTKKCSPPIILQVANLGLADIFAI